MDLSMIDKGMLAMYDRNTPYKHIAKHYNMTEERAKQRIEYLLRCEEVNDAETGSESKLDCYV